MAAGATVCASAQQSTLKARVELTKNGHRLANASKAVLWLSPVGGLFEPPRQETLPTEVTGYLVVQTVELLSFLRLFPDFKGLGRLDLHAERQLEGVNPRLQFRIGM